MKRTTTVGLLCGTGIQCHEEDRTCVAAKAISKNPGMQVRAKVLGQLYGSNPHLKEVDDQDHGTYLSTLLS